MSYNRPEIRFRGTNNRTRFEVTYSFHRGFTSDRTQIVPVPPIPIGALPRFRILIRRINELRESHSNRGGNSRAYSNSTLTVAEYLNWIRSDERAVLHDTGGLALINRLPPIPCQLCRDSTYVDDSFGDTISRPTPGNLCTACEFFSQVIHLLQRLEYDHAAVSLVTHAIAYRHSIQPRAGTPLPLINDFIQSFIGEGTEGRPRINRRVARDYIRAILYITERTFIGGLQTERWKH